MSIPHAVRFLHCLAIAVLAGALPACNHGKDSNSGQIQIKTLSNRADLISGGDALVEVVLPPRTRPSKVRVDVDGRDVTGAFAVRPNGRYMGVVTGLSVPASFGRSAPEALVDMAAAARALPANGRTCQ